MSTTKAHETTDRPWRGESADGSRPARRGFVLYAGMVMAALTGADEAQTAPEAVTDTYRHDA